MFKLDRTLIVIDVETTGVPRNGVTWDDISIIELGAVLFSPEGRIVDKFQSYVLPYTALWSAEAENVHKLSRKFLLKKGKPLLEVLNYFEQFICKQVYTVKLSEDYFKTQFQLAHWGSQFDSELLKSAYKHCQEGYWKLGTSRNQYYFRGGFEQSDKIYPFYHNILDIKSVVEWEFAKKGWTMDYKQGGGEEHSAKQLGIKVESKKCHGALYDAELQGLMLEKLINGN